MLRASTGKSFVHYIGRGALIHNNSSPVRRSGGIASVMRSGRSDDAEEPKERTEVQLTLSPPGLLE